MLHNNKSSNFKKHTVKKFGIWGICNILDTDEFECGVLIRLLVAPILRAKVKSVGKCFSWFFKRTHAHVKFLTTPTFTDTL